MNLEKQNVLTELIRKHHHKRFSLQVIYYKKDNIKMNQMNYFCRTDWNNSPGYCLMVGDGINEEIQSSRWLLLLVVVVLVVVVVVVVVVSSSSSSTLHKKLSSHFESTDFAPLKNVTVVKSFRRSS
jgi:hypothetical protein